MNKTLKKEFEIWFDKAEEDLDTAKYNLSGGKIGAGLFFLQQSVEKALKALHMKKSNELLKTHDLILLSRKVNAPKNIIEMCRKISPAYSYTRYPDVEGVENLEEISDDLLECSEKVLKWIKEQL